MVSHYEELLAAERAKYPEVEGNWPESITLNGESFSVVYAFDPKTKELEGFTLKHGRDELFSNDIAVIYLTEDQIWEIIDWEYGIMASRLTGKEARFYPEIHAAVASGKD